MLAVASSGSCTGIEPSIVTFAAVPVVVLAIVLGYTTAAVLQCIQ